MPKGSHKVFECLECTTPYSRQDLAKGLYFIESGICRSCYKKKQAASAKVSCFGKLPQGRLHGYDADHVACKTLCPDRTVCAQFVAKIQKEK